MYGVDALLRSEAVAEGLGGTIEAVEQLAKGLRN